MKKQPWTYWVRRIAFSIYQTLGFVKRARGWSYATKELLNLGKNVWLSLLSLWYSICSNRGQDYEDKMYSMG